MKLYIKNIAKIEECNIEFNGITVIAGENSTGKSTISRALYSIFDSLYDYENNINKSISTSIVNHIVSLVGFDTKLQIMNDNIDKLISLRKKNIDIETVKKITNDVIDEYNVNFENDSDFENKKEDIFNSIFKLLKISDEEYLFRLINRAFNNEFNKQINSLYNNKKGIVSLDIKKCNINFEFDNNVLTKFENGNIKINNEILYFDTPNILSNFYGNYIHFFNNHNDKNIRYIFRENDYNLVNDTILHKRLNPIENLVHKFEFSNIIKNNGSGLAILNKIYSKPLNINYLSTGSKSILLFLQIIYSEFLRDKNVLILDEPEINLHPEWQLILAEMIVLIQKEFSLTCLISSHSPYFINAIETYAHKYGTIDNTKFYFASNKDNKFSYFIDCTNTTNIIYKSLSKPFDKLMHERGNL